MSRHIRIPLLADITLVDDHKTIAVDEDDPRLDRNYEKLGPLGNRILAARLMRVFVIKGVHFPTMRGRRDAERQASQAALSERLGNAAAPTEKLIEAIEPLVTYVRGDAPEDTVGPVLQTLIGRLFKPDFASSPRLWLAATRFDDAARSQNPLRWLWSALAGTLNADRKVLAESVGGDPVAVHGIAIAIHNIVKSLALMRTAYADPVRRSTLGDKTAAMACLVAPDSVLRQAKSVAEIHGASLKPGSLVVYQLGTAARRAFDPKVAFQSNSWSFCPAADFVFKLLALIWAQAVQIPDKHEPAETPEVEASEGDA
ncbi:hypothetical protein ACMDCR_23295 [Labrys okinawensis]|uniref:hypothetical protein n=1 Tax=Labrys okinawensis TaxID=346911 RepID=UPI0039BCFBEA